MTVIFVDNLTWKKNLIEYVEYLFLIKLVEIQAVVAEEKLKISANQRPEQLPMFIDQPIIFKLGR